MSSFVYMKILESTAQRYDRGMHLLSRGRIGALYDELAQQIARPGSCVLDVGCGTGGVALACAARGAHVVGIDSNADMLAVARSKTVPGDAGGSVEWLELGAAEIEDRFPPERFDAISACLMMSELSADEQRYLLRVAHSRLVGGGVLVIADEMLAATATERLWRRIGRWPLAAITFALTQTTTRPVPDLVERIREAGFAAVEEIRPAAGGITIVSGKREEASS